MNLNNGEFETIGEYEMFCIEITQETLVPSDGGFSTVKTSNRYDLDRIQARDLLNELKLYLGDV